MSLALSLSFPSVQGGRGLRSSRSKPSASPPPRCISASSNADYEEEAHALFERINKAAEAVFVEDDAAALSPLPTETAPLPISSDLALERLVRFGDVLERAKKIVDEAPPRNAPPDSKDHVKSFGRSIAEAAVHIFNPSESADEIFKGTGLSGWSGDVRTKKRLTMRLDALHAWQRHALSQRK